MTEKEQKIFNLQCESTKALMLAQSLRPESEDGAYIARIKNTPIDIKAQCVKEDGSVDLNVRELSVSEFNLHNNARSERGAIIGEIRGDKPVHTLNEEKKERAQSAFMRTFSVAALKDKFKSIMKDLFKPDYAQIMAEAMKRSKDEI